MLPKKPGEAVNLFVGGLFRPSYCKKTADFGALERAPYIYSQPRRAAQNRFLLGVIVPERLGGLSHPFH